MSFCRSSLRCLPSPSSSSSLSSPTLTITRSKHTRGSTSSLWLSKTHLRASPSIPAPLVPTYPMRIVLSDGSTFTAYTTAPSPSTKKMTRDVLNNPLWSPASERKGLGEGEEGRVGRFRKRFEGLALDNTSTSGTSTETAAEGQDGAAPVVEGAFDENDFEWMSQGAKEEKANDKQRNPTKATKGKGGKKK